MMRTISSGKTEALGYNKVDIPQDYVVEPSRYSLDSTLTSSTSLTTSTSSGSTIQGPGSLSGKAILALGKVTLRGAEFIIIRRRLSAIASKFPLRDSSNVKGVGRMYDDLLELSRLGMYPDNVRDRAIQILLIQIAMRETKDMIESLAKWPEVETQIWISGLVTILDPIRLSHPETKTDASVKAYQGSLASWESHSLSPLLAFFDRLTQSIGSTGTAALLQLDTLNFFLHLYVTNFRDPLADTDRSSISRTSTLQAACNALLRDFCKAEVGLSAICDHPLHALWHMRPQTSFTVHLPERAGKRRMAWNSVSRTVILWRLHSTFELMLDSTSTIDDSVIYDITGDLLELSSSRRMDSEIKIRALRSLHRVITSGNVSTQHIIGDYLASCSLEHCSEIVSDIIQQLYRLIPPDTPESKVFFLQWDHNFFVSNAVLHFLHLFLNIARYDEGFLKVVRAANVLGLMQPFLEAELHNRLEVRLTPHDGDDDYQSTDSAILAQYEKHGRQARSLDPPLGEETKPASSYRSDLLRRAFDVFSGQGGSHELSVSLDTDWDDLPSSLDGSDRAAVWIRT